MHRISVKLLVFFALATTMMSAQASRTWVSGVGDDANPCSRTAPCKTWAGAISKTAPGGEIDALDPGGFGAVTITKAITLDGGGGQVASVLVSGTNGIVVQAGPSDVVILRNLRINGIGSGLNGIQFLSGKDLNGENVYVFGFTQNGINIALNQATKASAHILNSVVKNNSGVGIRATNAVSPPVQVMVDNSAAILDTIGIEAAQHSQVIVNRSLANKASSDGLKAADAAPADSELGVDHTEVTDNNNGITATAGGLIHVGDCKIANNSGTGSNQAGGTITFFTQTNRVHSNGAAGTFGTQAQQ